MQIGLFFCLTLLLMGANVAHAQWMPLVSETYRSIAALDSNSSAALMVVSQDGKIVASRDNGSRWHLMDYDTSGGWSSIVSTGSFNFLAVGSHGRILRGGLSSDKFQRQIYQAARSWAGAVVSGSDVIVVGTHGAIGLSSISDTNWRQPNSSPILDATLFSVAFQGTLGVAVGDNGTIVRTTNSGLDWSIVNSQEIARLNAVTFLGPGIAAACGEFSGILLTTDGGATWARRSLQSQIDSGYHYCLVATGDSSMLVFGAGQVHVTSDIGVSWKES